MEALKEIQLRFYKDFPPHPKEEVYGFATPSTMKPTQWNCKFWVDEWEIQDVRKNPCLFATTINFTSFTDPGGGINQIPAECTISGDVRFIIFDNYF